MKKGISVILGFAVGLAAVVFGQTIVQRPRYPQTGMSYVGIGDQVPTDPWGTELFIDVDGSGDNGPLFQIYDEVNTTWDALLSVVAGTGTQNTVPKFGAGGTILQNSTVTDDATDVVATGGLFTAGSAVDAADSILLDGNNDTLQFEGPTADGNEILFVAANPNTDLTFFMDNPIAGASGTWLEIDGAITARDVGVTWMGLHIDLDSPANHLGGAIMRGIEVDNDTNTAAGEETGLHFTTGWDAEIHFADPTATLWWLETGNFTLQDYGGSVELILEDIPDSVGADGTWNIIEVDVALPILDAGDLLRGLFIDLGSAVHTGGALYAIDIDNNVASAGAQIGMRIGSGFDQDIVFVDASATLIIPNNGAFNVGDTGAASNLFVRDVPAAGTAADLAELAHTLAVLDDNADISRSLFINIANADHTAAATNPVVIGIEVDIDVPDAEAYETAFLATNAWDYTLRQTGTVFANLPPAVVGAMVYCTNCDLASVPCASTPGPGAWAFGTSTGPRWECPW